MKYQVKSLKYINKKCILIENESYKHVIKNVCMLKVSRFGNRSANMTKKIFARLGFWLNPSFVGVPYCHSVHSTTTGPFASAVGLFSHEIFSMGNLLPRIFYYQRVFTLLGFIVLLIWQELRKHLLCSLGLLLHFLPFDKLWSFLAKYLVLKGHFRATKMS